MPSPLFTKNPLLAVPNKALKIHALTALRFATQREFDASSIALANINASQLSLYLCALFSANQNFDLRLGVQSSLERFTNTRWFSCESSDDLSAQRIQREFGDGVYSEIHLYPKPIIGFQYGRYNYKFVNGAFHSVLSGGIEFHGPSLRDPVVGYIPQNALGRFEPYKAIATASHLHPSAESQRRLVEKIIRDRKKFLHLEHIVHEVDPAVREITFDFNIFPTRNSPLRLPLTKHYLRSMPTELMLPVGAFWREFDPPQTMSVVPLLSRVLRDKLKPPTIDPL